MTKEKASIRLAMSLFTIYTLNCFGKLAFPAVTAALVDEMILTKTQAGLIGGMFWLLYAAGQLFGGVVSNRLSPYKLLTIGLIGSGICNILMAILPYYIPMFIFWGINGVIQFGIWPSVLKLVSTSVLESHRSKTYNILAYGFCVGSILGQLCTALVLTFLPWNVMFVCCGSVNLLMLIPVAICVRRYMPLLDSYEQEDTSGDKGKKKLPIGLILESGFVFFAILVCIKSFLDTGIKNWMPTILMETYSTSPSYSTLLSVIMMGVSLLGVSVGAKIYKTVKNSEAKMLCVMYVCVLPLMLLLLNFRNMNIFITTLILSLIALFIYGSGQAMLMYYPARLERFGLTSVVGGFMNSCAAFGNVLATSGNGTVADLFGWDACIIVWVSLTVLFIVLTVSLIPVWKKFLEKHT